MDVVYGVPGNYQTIDDFAHNYLVLQWNFCFIFLFHQWGMTIDQMLIYLSNFVVFFSLQR